MWQCVRHTPAESISDVPGDVIAKFLPGCVPDEDACRHPRQAEQLRDGESVLAALVDEQQAAVAPDADDDLVQRALAGAEVAEVVGRVARPTLGDQLLLRLVAVRRDLAEERLETSQPALERFDRGAAPLHGPRSDEVAVIAVQVGVAPIATVDQAVPEGPERPSLRERRHVEVPVAGLDETDVPPGHKRDSVVAQRMHHVSRVDEDHPERVCRELGARAAPVGPDVVVEREVAPCSDHRSQRARQER
jgi:hypothetical protein